MGYLRTGVLSLGLAIDGDPVVTSYRVLQYEIRFRTGRHAKKEVNANVLPAVNYGIFDQ